MIGYHTSERLLLTFPAMTSSFGISLRFRPTIRTFAFQIKFYRYPLMPSQILVVMPE